MDFNIKTQQSPLGFSIKGLKNKILGCFLRFILSKKEGKAPAKQKDSKSVN